MEKTRQKPGGANGGETGKNGGGGFRVSKKNPGALLVGCCLSVDRHQLSSFLLGGARPGERGQAPIESPLLRQFGAAPPGNLEREERKSWFLYPSRFIKKATERSGIEKTKRGMAKKLGNRVACGGSRGLGGFLSAQKNLIQNGFFHPNLFYLSFGLCPLCGKRPRGKRIAPQSGTKAVLARNPRPNRFQSGIGVFFPRSVQAVSGFPVMRGKKALKPGPGELTLLWGKFLREVSPQLIIRETNLKAKKPCFFRGNMGGRRAFAWGFPF